MAHQVKMIALLTVNELDSSVKEELSSLLLETKIDIHAKFRLYVFEVTEENSGKVSDLKLGMHKIIYSGLTEVTCDKYSKALRGIHTLICDAVDFLDEITFGEGGVKLVSEKTLDTVRKIMEGVVIYNANSSDSKEYEDNDSESEDSNLRLLNLLLKKIQEDIANYKN